MYAFSPSLWHWYKILFINKYIVVVILFPDEYNMIHSIHTKFQQFHKCIHLVVAEKLSGSSSWQPHTCLINIKDASSFWQWPVNSQSRIGYRALGKGWWIWQDWLVSLWNHSFVISTRSSCILVLFHVCRNSFVLQMHFCLICAN